MPRICYERWKFGFQVMRERKAHTGREAIDLEVSVDLWNNSSTTRTKT